MSQLTAVPVHEDIGAGASYEDRTRGNAPWVDAKDMIVDYTDSPMASEFTEDSLNGTFGNLQVRSFDSSPSQIPFDDLTIRPPLRQQNLAISTPQQGSPSPVESATGSIDSSVMGGHSPYSNAQQHSTTSLQQQRPRPELLHATRSSPGPRGMVGSRPDLNSFPLHDESPFEAARRAQRIAKSTESLHKQAQPQERKFIPGHVPSIKPGEIMPDYLIPLLHGPPTFAPLIDAPPFPPLRPPVVHPIRAAHFPNEPGQPGFIPSPVPHPLPYLSGPDQQYRQSTPPSSHPQVPPNGPHTAAQAADMSRSYPPVQSQQQPQLLRSPSYAHTPSPPVNWRTSQKPQSPNSSRRHTYDPSKGALGQSSVSNGNYPPPPMPRLPDLSQGQSSAQPLSRSASHYHVARPSPPPEVSTLPPPRHSPPPLSTRDSFRQSLRPSPLRSEFAPAPSPIRLPSENMGLQAPVSVPNRSTPRPVMPPLLAPLANQNNNASRSAPHLQRSMSSGQEKGGFLSKTKSLLRKRTSGSGLKLRADGGISFAPPMHTVQEEDARPGKKLNKRK